MHLQTSHQPVLRLGFGDWTCNWGTHVCGLYETDAERDEIVMGFLHQGDLDGDLQLYCPSQNSTGNFIAAYGALFPGQRERPRDPARFQLLPARDLYYPQGEFSPWAMEQGLDAFYEQSQGNGPRNIRASADMVWALEAITGVEHLMAYESRLNYFIPGKPWVSICLYDVRRFSGSTVMEVLRTHPYAISGGTMTENPYYQDPDTWLAKNAPQFLTHN